MQNEEQKKSKPLFEIAEGRVPQRIIISNNAAKSWEYGYNNQYDIIVISKDGTIGDIYKIGGIYIAIPSIPKVVDATSDYNDDQVWRRDKVPPAISRIKSRQQWNMASAAFQNQYADYINEQFDKRENGYWFMNDGVPTYITGSHWFYLQWAKIDVGYPEYREANRILYYFWEACRADYRCFGMCYLKIRRSGFSFMGASEAVNIATTISDSLVGMLSKTGKDASSLFTKKVVPINSALPFFFKPIMDGMDKPKTELSYAIPATRITKKNMNSVEDESEDGLNTVIDWRNTDDNSYDSEKLRYLLHDESFKWLAPNNIKNNWRVTKTCLRIGQKVIGKCMMGSTCNALAKGGQNGKDLFYASKTHTRNPNGETQSGLYALFIPMEYNTEGFIDKHGKAVLHKPTTPIYSSDGIRITNGAIDWWEGEVKGKKNDPDDLNEFYRQYPRTENHAFRDESKNSLYNLTKIYTQIDYNDSLIIGQHLMRGNFSWKNGIKDTQVVWNPNEKGRFYVSWLPPKELQNNVTKRNGLYYPNNDHMGCFGCDSYDISGVVKGGGSKGALHLLLGFHMEEAPNNQFVLEYISRAATAEIFFEDVLMALVFYGIPMLAENNKPRLLYHLKHRGYRPFSMNRPDKAITQLSKTEREIGGIPSSSADMIQAHSSAIESYIEKYIGLDYEGRYRPQDVMGQMPFNRTLLDWAKFNIFDREKFDATVSSGLAIMGTQKHLYRPEAKTRKISINFNQYDNSQLQSILKTHG